MESNDQLFVMKITSVAERGWRMTTEWTDEEPVLRGSWTEMRLCRYEHWVLVRTLSVKVVTNVCHAEVRTTLFKGPRTVNFVLCLFEINIVLGFHHMRSINNKKKHANGWLRTKPLYSFSIQLSRKVARNAQHCSGDFTPFKKKPGRSCYPLTCRVHDRFICLTAPYIKVIFQMFVQLKVAAV